MFLAFRICARPIFSENGKDIFLFGVLPSKYSGRWRSFNSDSVLPKLFSGDMDFRKTETNLFFAFCPRGGGVWGGIRAGFGILFFWQGGLSKIIDHRQFEELIRSSHTEQILCQVLLIHKDLHYQMAIP